MAIAMACCLSTINLLRGLNRAAPLRRRITTSASPFAMAEQARLEITAVGAHMRGLPLNYQLTELGAMFVREARTVCAGQGHVQSHRPCDAPPSNHRARPTPQPSQLQFTWLQHLACTVQAPVYRLFSLGPRPLLVRQAQQDSSTAAISLEIWSVPSENVGRFLAQIPSPLGLGTVQLSDGTSVKGFIGEAFAATQEGAVEITHFGGWRAYMASKAS